MAKIGVPKYRDVVNAETINKIKDSLNALCIQYNNFVSEKSVSNRESDLWDIYKGQYNLDFKTLAEMRGNAQAIADVCNAALYTISSRALYEHVYVNPVVEAARAAEEENNEEQ